MAYVGFIMKLHKSSKRGYVERVVSYDKAECAEVAIQDGRDYGDGERQYGYGGYSYVVNGSIYLNARTMLLEDQTFLTRATLPYFMPNERSLQIDEPWDLHLAELILRDRL